MLSKKKAQLPITLQWESTSTEHINRLVTAHVYTDHSSSATTGRSACSRWLLPVNTDAPPQEMLFNMKQTLLQRSVAISQSSGDSEARSTPLSIRSRQWQSSSMGRQWPVSTETFGAGAFFCYSLWWSLILPFSQVLLGWALTGLNGGKSYHIQSMI